MALNNRPKPSPSKIHENTLRIKVLHTLMRNGYASAKNALKFCSWHLGRNLRLTKKEVSNNCYGVEKELDFYASFDKKYSLIPTLDAGCQFDFVGQLHGSIVALDVCGGLGNKSDMAECFGVLRWRRYAVWVKCVNVDWYWMQSGRLQLAGLPTDRVAIQNGGVMSRRIVTIVPDVESFEFLRHIWLSRAAGNERIGMIVDEIISSVGISVSEKGLLIAQIRFLRTYRYALNLVATLSFVEGVDFVGQHGSKLVRYHVITSYDECRQNEYPALSGLPYSSDEYKVVRYDDDEKVFEFKSIDDQVFFD